jgi:hypothetical protein
MVTPASTYGRSDERSGRCLQLAKGLAGKPVELFGVVRIDPTGEGGPKGETSEFRG